MIVAWWTGLLKDNLGKRNDDENAKEKLYTYVSHVPVITFKVCDCAALLYLGHSPDDCL